MGRIDNKFVNNILYSSYEIIEYNGFELKAQVLYSGSLGQMANTYFDETLCIYWPSCYKKKNIIL